MTPEEAAAATAATIVSLPAGFMLDAATFAHGAKVGVEGLGFYIGGRGGALGDVDADVVSAAMVFFEPGGVRAAWEAAVAVLTPRELAAEFAACCHTWAEEHLGDDVALGRLAELTGRVVGGASHAGAPLFAGWRRLLEPESPKALVLHRLNALRELRGAMHGGAVLAAGLHPRDAVLVKTPYLAPVFGWPEPYPDVSALAPAWEAAEAATNRAMAPAFAVLDDTERDELVELVSAVGGG